MAYLESSPWPTAARVVPGVGRRPWVVAHGRPTLASVHSNVGFCSLLTPHGFLRYHKSAVIVVSRRFHGRGIAFFTQRSAATVCGRFVAGGSLLGVVAWS